MNTEKSTNRRRWLWVIAAGALFVASCGTGEAGVTSYEVTPQACLDALDAADASHELSAEGFGAAARGFSAAAEFDIAGIDAATADMEENAPLLGAAMDEYRTARDECRGAQS